jgi:hypothetical protein
LNKDFHLLSNELEKLYRERLDLMDKLAMLKDQISGQTSILKLLDEKEEQLKRVEETLHAYSEKTVEMAQNQFHCEYLKEQVIKLKEDKEELLKFNHKSKNKKEELSCSLTKLEIILRHLEQGIDGRKKELQSLDKNYLDTKNKVETMRNEEFEMLKTLNHYQTSLGEMLKETAFLEASKIHAYKMQEESLKFLEERKVFYRHESELIEENYRSNNLKLEAEFQIKKLEWEKDYSSFIEHKESELNLRLDEFRCAEENKIQKKRNALTSGILEIIKRHDNHQGFVSQEQKSEEIKKEVSALFDQFYTRRKSWWKFWT